MEESNEVRQDTYNGLVCNKQIRWPHDGIHRSGQPPVYSDMSLALFTNGYFSVAVEESVVTQKYMYVHLQELMEDVEVSGWRTVKEYHAAWLQLME